MLSLPREHCVPAPRNSERTKFSSVFWGFPSGSVVKNLPAMQEMQEAQSQGQENPLEEEMAAYSSIPAWKIPWTEGPGGLQSIGLDTT